ncbi:MAG: sulfite exporter TauE/SafE family protein, partial [Planctomycetota bacterium]|nr:sulfite exporter TauE/SafE family protein [Planctomycetota bacterium]
MPETAPADLPPCCQVPDAVALPPGQALAHDLGLDLGSPYVQLVMLGLVMTLAHCGGMCGPIVMSLRFGMEQERRRGRALQALAQLAVYQSGRIVIYGLAGMIVGGAAMLLADAGVGESLGSWLGWVSNWLILVVALGFVLAAVLRIYPRKDAPVKAAGPLARLGARVTRSLQGKPLRRAGLMGLVMAFIPCGLPIWALGLAAISASPLHGALLMALMVVMSNMATSAVGSVFVVVAVGRGSA